MRNVNSRALICAFGVVLILTAGADLGSARQEQTKAKPSPNNLLVLLEKSGYSYSKVSEGTYEIPATGKNLKEFPLRIVLSDDLVVVISKIADRKKVTLREPLAVKLLELNHNFDVVKFALSTEMLYARIDIRSRLVDVDELKYLVETMAQVCDEAYAQLKPLMK